MPEVPPGEVERRIAAWRVHAVELVVEALRARDVAAIDGAGVLIVGAVGVGRAIDRALSSFAVTDPVADRAGRVVGLRVVDGLAVGADVVRAVFEIVLRVDLVEDAADLPRDADGLLAVADDLVGEIAVDRREDALTVGARVCGAGVTVFALDRRGALGLRAVGAGAGFRNRMASLISIGSRCRSTSAELAASRFSASMLPWTSLLSSLMAL